jgi:hypothetical protein
MEQESVESGLVERLWGMYIEPAREPNVLEELERLFPDDVDRQREYRDVLIDRDRKRRKHRATR